MVEPPWSTLPPARRRSAYGVRNGRAWNSIIQPGACQRKPVQQATGRACAGIDARAIIGAGRSALMSQELIRSIENEQLSEDIPDFRAGDTVKVYVKVVEGT